MKNELEAQPKDKELKVAAFYNFSPIREEIIASFLVEITTFAQERNLRGTVLIALEGINGTICGPALSVEGFLKQLDYLMLENAFEIKFSFSSKQIFRRFKARKKNEIVTMGVKGLNPNKVVGEYVEPEEWNTFIEDSSTLVIDTRNKYEVAIGSFDGAINPHTNTFREFPNWVNHTLRPLVIEKEIKRIAMFCTGGIRCEKATSFLKQEGFADVHHLHGGILKYLEKVPKDRSRWHGECFVFDHRVALNHRLLPGVHRLCFACGIPLSPNDRKKINYIPGIQCHHCEDIFSDDDRARFQERQNHIKKMSNEIPNNSLWPGL